MCRLTNPSETKYIAGVREQIDRKAHRPADMALCWAIMETEAWILGLYICFERIDRRLTAGYIQAQLGLDVKTIDPETTFFHPANEVKQIFQLAGRSYGKSQGEVNAILGHLEKADFSELLDSDRCASFTDFHKAWQAGR